MKKERPFELNAVIVITIVFGFVSIILSRYYILNQESFFSDLNQDLVFYFMIYVYASMAIGFIQLIVAYGLYKAMLWAWYLAVIGCGIFLFTGVLFSVLIVPDVFTIFINMGCLFLLYKSNVRKYFEK